MHCGTASQYQYRCISHDRRNMMKEAHRNSGQKSPSGKQRAYFLLLYFKCILEPVYFYWSKEVLFVHMYLYFCSSNQCVYFCVLWLDHKLWSNQTCALFYSKYFAPQTLIGVNLPFQVFLGRKNHRLENQLTNEWIK